MHVTEQNSLAVAAGIHVSCRHALRTCALNTISNVYVGIMSACNGALRRMAGKDLALRSCVGSLNLLW
jgi:hypothetical protein